MKLLLKLLKVAIIVGLVSACSQHQTKSSSKNTKNTNDRSASIAYNSSLSFISNEGDTLATIQIAIADDEEERSEGLMDVHSMPENEGMLFIFEQEQQLSFWMANTPLPLDIIFVNKDKKIVRIHHNTQPFTEENFSSDALALYAIETNGGFAVSHDIQEGMKVAF